MLCTPSPTTTSMTSARLLNTTSSSVCFVSVTRTVIFSLTMSVPCFRPDGGLGAKRLHHNLVGLDIRPADEIDAVGHSREDAVHDGFTALVLHAFERFL